MSKSTVLSCIQPSGELHLGNYFGAVANWVKLQDSYRCLYGVVDLHVMTMPYDSKQLRQSTEQMAIDLLACGIDPAKSIVFIQSLVPEHAELCWILNCVCSFGDLTRQTQFKDKSSQIENQTGGDFISAGLFTYPVLQAADILIYRADYVPVGRDQEQHLELTRDIARRFNSQFGQFFPEPKVLSTPTPKIFSPADPEKKMSKSLGPKHYIGLFESEEGVRAKIRTAVTDSGALPPGFKISPGVENLFEMLKACGKQDEAAALLKDYEAGQLKYTRLKEATADALVELTGRLRARRAEIASDTTEVMKKVREMSEQARAIAAETLRQVRALVGLLPRS
jgi:tryptophanyl-tRNA synthetase